jgi:predicted GH43/DUF377 family glycosyl hydrolase
MKRLRGLFPIVRTRRLVTVTGIVIALVAGVGLTAAAASPDGPARPALSAQRGAPGSVSASKQPAPSDPQVSTSDQPVATSDQSVLPPWAVGPFTRYSGNPVLTPQGTGFEQDDTFNPGVVYANGKFEMLYRAQAANDISTIGYAYSTDGHHFTRYAGNPVIQPDGTATESGGIDDPRLYKLGNTYYTFVSGYNWSVTPPQTIVEYTSTDLVSWHEVGDVVHTNYDPAVVTNGNDIPVKLSTPYGPRYVMYYGDSDPAKGRFIAYSTNMTTWTNNTPLDMHFPANYDPWEICVTVTDYQTVKNGPVQHDILMFVAGTMMAQGRWYYAISEVDFSGANPGEQLDQLTTPILQPQAPYEQLGQTQRTMFMNTIMFHDGQWWMYYGAGDTVVALANAPLRSQASAQAYSDFTGTGFESGQRQPDWVDEVDTGPGGGGLANVSAPAGSGLSGPESMVTYQSTAHTGDAALSFSGTAGGSAQDDAYMRLFDLSSAPVPVGKNTTLSYWIFPDSSDLDGSVSGSNSTCVALDMVFTDGTALRNAGAKDSNGNSFTPSGQCGHLTPDQWDHVTVDVGAVAAGKDISRIDVGYDQPGSSGGFHSYIDDISLNPGDASISAPATANPTSDITVTARFVNPGGSEIHQAHFSLQAPAGWQVQAQAPLPGQNLGPQQAADASWRVSIPESAQATSYNQLTASLTYNGQGPSTQRLAAATSVAVNPLASAQLSPSSAVLQPGGTVSVDVDLSSQATKAISVGYQANAPSGITVTRATGTSSLPAGGTATVKLAVSLAQGTAVGSYQLPIVISATDQGTTYPLTTLRLPLAVPYSSLSAAFNNTGISDDSAPGTASFDGGPDSYSAEALAAAGVTPGGSLTTNGLTFTWPNVPAGDPDNVTGNGQAISLANVGSGSVLGFLGAGDSGPQSGPVTITYSDGTTQTAQLGFSDWTLGGGSDSPSFGNQIVATMPYRNTSGGQQSVKTYLFLAEIPLASGKTVTSITLPTGETKLHIFDVTVGTPKS